MRLCLIRKPQYDDPRIFLWRIGAEIGKIGVERDQYLAFCFAGSCYFRIGFSTQALVEDRGHLVSGIRENSCRIFGNVLIELDVHWSCRQRYDLLSRELGSVSDGSLNGFQR